MDLLDSATGPGDWPLLAAVAGALLAARARSLLLVPIAGLSAYGLTPAWLVGS